MSLAIVFPGQGSQSVGMGQNWAVNYDAVRELFNTADQVLGYSLSGLCFNGPEDDLKLTANQQPGILAVSYAIWQIISELVPEPAYFAGHSLGEYTALVAAGAMSFEDAIATVHRRGSLMQEAVPVGEGAMAAVLRLPVEKISEINSRVVKETGKALEIANLNSPEQIVVTGSADAVRIAIPLYTEAGAKRVVELPVSAPFHSSLMMPAADGLKPRLDEISFSVPATPVISNLTVHPYPANPGDYPMLLHAQIFNPVRWTETIQYFAAQGVTHLIEVGPGNVLRMLAPKITREISASSIECIDQLDELKSWITGMVSGEEGQVDG